MISSVPTSVADLVAASTAAVKADTTWLGSEDHRLLLESYVQGRAAVTALAWGATSDWDRKSKTITLEIPVGSRPPEEAARLVAFNAFHESLHARYSNDADAKIPAFFELVVKLEQQGDPEGMFLRLVSNWLEDERIMLSELAVSKQDAAEIDQFRTEVVAQNVGLYKGKHSESLWTKAPAEKRDQLIVALAALIFAPETVDLLAPDVAERLAASKPHVDHAVNGSMVDVAGAARALWAIYAPPF